MLLLNFKTSYASFMMDDDLTFLQIHSPQSSSQPSSNVCMYYTLRMNVCIHLSNVCMHTLSLWLFNFYVEYIMWNTRLDEAQTGIKVARRNISNPRYADNTTLIAESEEELNSLLINVKYESEKAGLKLNIQKTKVTYLVPLLN